MSSYIMSEFYRVLRKKSSYFFIGVCTLLLISSNVLLAIVKQTDSSFPYATTDFSFSMAYTGFQTVFLLCIAVASMIFANENSEHTMKNSISYGISRGTIYFGKLIVEVLYSVVALVIILGIYVASAYLLLENSGAQPFETLLKVSFLCIPLFLFALGATNCFVFIMENTGAAVSAVVSLVLVVPLVSNLLGMKFELFQKLSKVLPWNMISNINFKEHYKLILPWEGNAGYYNYWIIGIVEMILVTVIGYIIFRKKEIK